MEGNKVIPGKDDHLTPKPVALIMKILLENHMRIIRN
jgi:hypothetical protein